MTKTLCGLILAAGLAFGSVATAAEPAGQPSRARTPRRRWMHIGPRRCVRTSTAKPQAVLAHLADSVRLMPGVPENRAGEGRRRDLPPGVPEAVHGERL